MGFRDDREALRARVDALERELARKQLEAERAAELERELAEARARIERLEKEDLEGDEELRAELRRARERIGELEAKVRAREERAAPARDLRDRAKHIMGVLVIGTLLFLGAMAWAASMDEDRSDRAPFGPAAPDVPSGTYEAPPGEPDAPQPPSPLPRPPAPVGPDVLVRRWGTSTTEGWRHANGRCEVALHRDDVLSVTCRGEEIRRQRVMCAEAYATCESEDGALTVDFAGASASVQTSEGPIEIALDPP